jgi:hypothetical protein
MGGMSGSAAVRTDPSPCGYRLDGGVAREVDWPRRATASTRHRQFCHRSATDLSPAVSRPLRAHHPHPRSGTSEPTSPLSVSRTTPRRCRVRDPPLEVDSLHVHLHGRLRARARPRLRGGLARRARVLRDITRAGGLLSGRRLRDYEAVDPGNPRLRSPMNDIAQSTAEPGSFSGSRPLRPTTDSTGPSVVPICDASASAWGFSSWSAVPKAVSVLLSYET